jgi:hypothetical protein
MASKLLYPEPLSMALIPLALSASLSKVHVFGTSIPMAHRVPLLFETPARVQVRVSSLIGADRGWVRAGSLAQVLYGLDGDPKKEVSRVFLDEGFYEFDGAGFSYYLEFWPYRWLTDYLFEVWAALPA